MQVLHPFDQPVQFGNLVATYLGMNYQASDPSEIPELFLRMRKIGDPSAPRLLLPFRLTRVNDDTVRPNAVRELVRGLRTMLDTKHLIVGSATYY